MRYARLVAISLGVSILAAAPAAAQRVAEAQVGMALRAASTPDAPLHAWSEPRREIPLGPFVVVGAAVGGVLAVRSLMDIANGDDWVDPRVAVLYVGRGVAFGALCGLAVGAILRELVR